MTNRNNQKIAIYIASKYIKPEYRSNHLSYQEREAIQWANQRGWDYEIYVESNPVDYDKPITHRPELCRLLSGIEEDTIKNVFVTDKKVLTPKKPLYAYVGSIFNRKNVPLHTLSQEDVLSKYAPIDVINIIIETHEKYKLIRDKSKVYLSSQDLTQMFE